MSFDWGYTLDLFGDPDFWRAVGIVVQLSLFAWISGICLGFLLALGKLSTNLIARWPATIYIWFFRSVPLLVLLIFVYNLPQVFPAASAVLSSPFAAGLLALILSESAYIAEIHRGGLLSVPVGQVEAGRALGLRFVGIQRLIVVPQALRIALPTLGNQYVTIVKLTSLVSVISLAEILYVGQQLYTSNFKVLETMLAVAIYYVLIVTVADNALAWLERRLDVRRPRRRAGRRYEAARVSDRPVLRAPATDKLRCNNVALHAEGLYKTFGHTTVLANANLTVSRGEVISIIGPSGSGKTTFIRTLNHLAPPDRGTIRLGDDLLFRSANDPGGPAVSPSRHQIRELGMVFQNFNLFPHRSVLDNVMLGPRYHRLDKPEAIRDNALALLKKVGLLEHADKFPHALSGGQQQRVAIARALAMQPEILLFDEPTSALDPELVGEVLGVIEDLASEGLTMLVVTHEMQFAYRVSDRIVLMDRGQIVDCAPPDELFNRADDSRAAQFLKHSHVS